MECLVNHSQEVSVILKEYDIDVLLISETHYKIQTRHIQETSQIIKTREVLEAYPHFVGTT